MKRNVILKILIYFIVYSIIGFLLETIFALFTKGMLESRQSFLYGPFCIVYGIGAICLIFPLKKYKDNAFKLFFYGMFIGGVVEYYSSYLGEVILHVKWWDYSNAFLNIHGRTCLFYAVMWGILTIALIRYINPLIDKLIMKLIQSVSRNVVEVMVTLIILFMFADGAITCYALDNFLVRVSQEYDVAINGIDSNKELNENLGNLYNNERMMMVYPNIIVVNDNQEDILLESVLHGVKNYYYKFGKK